MPDAGRSLGRSLQQDASPPDDPQLRANDGINLPGPPLIFSSLPTLEKYFEQHDKLLLIQPIAPQLNSIVPTKGNCSGLESA